MNVGAITCAIMAGFFIALAIVFAILKGKSAILISGFNTVPKEEREKYNTLKMSVDIRNALFVWSVVFAVGGVLSYLFSDYIAILALIIWARLFVKEVHLDPEKAFEKYRV